jgi:alpha-beta hydrolase superfamily lysophospholipase
MLVELVRTVTRDGLRLDGALALPAVETGVSARPQVTVILLHGVAANFYTSSTFEPLIPKLNAAGMAVLAVNTRGHDAVFNASLGSVRRRLGAAFEIVSQCRDDIAAWIRFAQERWSQRVVLIGHSLGAIKAVFSQAHEPHPAVAAVVAASGPRLSYAAFTNSAESSQFDASYRTAVQMAAERHGEELFTANFPFPLLIAASAYIDKYGPGENYNLLEFAAKLSVPALFTYGSKELATGGIAFAGMPEAIDALPRSAPRDVAVIDGADHLYTGVAGTLADRIVAWLQLEQAK